MTEETSILRAAQQNVEQLLNDIEEGDLQDGDETTPERALQAAQTHHESAVEQQQRSRRIAQTAAATVAILESIVDFDGEPDGLVGPGDPEDQDDPAPVEGVSDE